MTNDDAYAAGLLNRALDPATQPHQIRQFLQAEIDLLHDVIGRNARLLDVGCGTGRHLALLGARLRLGVGLDYEYSYVSAARQHVTFPHVFFITGDATAMPLATRFDIATCLTNTWGTMTDKSAVLEEMRRLAPTPGTRMLSVFSSTSIAPRREWYERLGHTVLEESDQYLLTGGGFRSEHFSQDRLRGLIGDCTIRTIADVAWFVTF